MREKYGYSKIDDLYASIGFGTIGAQKIAYKLLQIYKKNNEEEEVEKKLKEIEEKTKKENTIKKQYTSSQGLYVKGLDNCLIKTAKCCSPVPGDEILGYITQGLGISVHRVNCSNVKNLMKNQNRIIDVYWTEDGTQSYNIEIEIFAVDSKGLLKDIIQTVDGFNTTLNGLDAGKNKDGLAVIKIKIIVKNQGEITKLINKLSQVENVIEIKRKIG